MDKKTYKLSEERRKKISERLKEVSRFRRRTAKGTFAKEPEKFTLRKQSEKIRLQKEVNETRTPKRLRGISVIKKYLDIGTQDTSGAFFEVVVIVPALEEQKYIEIFQSEMFDELTQKAIKNFRLKEDLIKSARLGIQRHNIEAIDDKEYIYVDNTYRKDKDSGNVRVGTEWRNIKGCRIKQNNKWVLNPQFSSLVRELSTSYVGFDYDNLSLGEVRSFMYQQKKYFEKNFSMKVRHSIKRSSHKGYHLRIVEPHFNVEQQFNLRQEYEDDEMRLKLDRQRFKKGLLFNVLFDEKIYLQFGGGSNE